MIYTGSCHCGDVRLEYETSEPISTWPLRACQCGFCRKHGVVTTSISNANLRIHADVDAIQEYTFALGVTRFQLCKRCGTYVAAISEYEGVQYAVVVANMLDCRSQLTQTVTPVVYDDENPDTRLERRAERWAKLVS